jgi:hypothetical protein
VSGERGLVVAEGTNGHQVVDLIESTHVETP